MLTPEGPPIAEASYYNRSDSEGRRLGEQKGLDTSNFLDNLRINYKNSGSSFTILLIKILCEVKFCKNYENCSLDTPVVLAVNTAR